MANLKRQHRHRRGTVLIEMAIVAALLVTIALYLMEYGWMFMKMSFATNAARQGARIGARPGATTGEITTAVASVMANGGLTGHYEVDYIMGDEVGEEVRVTVTVDYPAVRLLPGLALIPVPETLTATTVMAREG